ncbi:MAG: triose-phosphate isomerase [Clostridia bacterium]|nr:triose-phosphate isomerase [Clostridia bacterium]
MNRKYRKTIIAGNWKMNKLTSEVKPFFDELRSAVARTKTCDIVICAPFTALPSAVKAGKECRALIGAQDVSEHKSGAYTGQVSAEMLTDLGVKYGIVGHSERRGFIGETDSQVNAKALTLLENGITPIICVGENLGEREKGLTMALVTYQVKSALAGIDEKDIKKCVFAYEPLWAIGTGKTATPEQAETVCKEIRAIIRRIYGARSARAVSILYGGSMNAANCDELLAQPDIDGGLIGGASLKPLEFASIIAATAAE